MKLLVVDDSPEVIEAVSVSFSLQWRDTEVIGAEDGESGLLAIEREQPDLVLLDIAMPGIDGFETLRRAREFSDVPVILLTARDTVVDKVKGLELGADDYVTKPFDHLELLARVKAVLRRLDMPQPVSRAPSFTLHELTMDFASHEVRLRGERVPLTATEYKLLYQLVRNAGHVLTHAAAAGEGVGARIPRGGRVRSGLHPPPAAQAGRRPRRTVLHPHRAGDRLPVPQPARRGSTGA